jgi:hypothetical protein
MQRSPKLPRTARFARVLVLTLVAAASLSPAPALAQCAMCRDYVYSQTNREQNDRTARAIYHSILGMLGVPLVLVGGLGALVFVNSRALTKAAKAAAAEGAATTATAAREGAASPPSPAAPQGPATPA